MATVTQLRPTAVDPVVLLVDARTPTEHELVARWARETHPGAPIIERHDPLSVRRLERGDDPLIVPVR